MRTTQGRLNESGIVQPQAQGHGNQQARSNKTVTQPSLSLDSYQSRKAYGFRNMTDFTAERGQKGISDVQAATSRHAQEGWSRATNGAKRGNDIVQGIRNEIFSKYQERPVFTTAAIPNVQMQGYQSEVIGEPDLGDVTVDIQTEPNARISYTPGSVETHLDEGFIHHWVSMGNYDINI
jgi:hypothetical protein